MSTIASPHFHDADAAREYLERLRWPNGPVCPKCGSVDNAYTTKKPGVRRCAESACRKDFSVTVGTLFERSHVPLHKWLLAAYLIAASKKGISAHQISRMLEVTYKTAWFLSHRLREAMREGSSDIFGGGGGAVEVDETYIGREPGKPVKRAFHHKMKVLSLVDRTSGRARSMVIDDVKPATIAPILRENLARETRLMTDEAAHYLHIGREFASHGVVRHGRGQYVSYDDATIHTQTIEGYFSIFKRGMKGIYQHCAKRHLHRYLAEFDFRYSNRVALGVDDGQRMDRLLAGINGRRLMYGACVAS